MAANQTECFQLEQRFIMKYLAIEKCKPREIYRWMCVVYGEVCSNKKKGYFDFIKSRNSIQDEDRLDRLTMVSTLEMNDSVNVLILSDRRVTIEGISKKQRISMDTNTQNYAW